MYCAGVVTGPILVSDFMGSPILAERASSSRRSTNLSLIEFCTSRREPAMQVCPVAAKMPETAPAAAAVEIGILEHDVRRLAAELERDPLQALRRGLVDLRAGRVRTGEGDLGDAGMADQLGADLRPEAGDHVEDAVGNAGFLRQRGEFQRAGRGEFRRLDDDGATGGERGGAFPGDEQQRRIPGGQRRDDADRLMRGVGKGLRLVDRHQAAFELVDEPAEIPPPLRMIAQLPQHLGHQLAVVAHLDLGETLRVRGDEIAELAHDLAPRGRRHLRPWAAPHRLIGGLHGLVGIGLRGARNFGPRLAAIGIDGLEPLAIGGIDILAVDVELIGFHVYPPIDARDGSGWHDDTPAMSCAQARIRDPGHDKHRLVVPFQIDDHRAGEHQ